MTLEGWAKYEQACLWHELEEEIDRAVNGAWSMGASDKAARIVYCARLVGPTPWGEVPWALATGRVYEEVLRIGGVEPAMPSVDDFARYVEVMKDYGSPKQHALRYAPTIAAMHSSHKLREDLDES